MKYAILVHNESSNETFLLSEESLVLDTHTIYRVQLFDTKQEADTAAAIESINCATDDIITFTAVEFTQELNDKYNNSNDDTLC